MDGPDPPPLPYDPGNAGDLLKHGMLAELVVWWLAHHPGPLRFADPFGGRPWLRPHPEVVRRLAGLKGTALAAVQDDPQRYLGSGHLVAETARRHGGAARVAAADRDPAARRALEASGLAPLTATGFRPGDGFSVLHAELDADLLLLDPFADFIETEAERVLPAVAAAACRTAVVVFVPDPGPETGPGRRLRALKADCLTAAWSLRCPPLTGTPLRGESGHHSELLLAAPWLDGPAAGALAQRLAAFVRRLARVLDAPVSLRRT